MNSWKEKLIQYIYAINKMLIACPDRTLAEWCQEWGGYDWNGKDRTFKFKSDDFEFMLGEFQNKIVLLGECRLWLEQEKFKPFELMSINLIKFIEDEKLNLASAPENGESK